jgi:predicted transcriptional regulator
LLDDIEVALDLTPDADTMRPRCQKSDRHEKTLSRLLEHLTECGHFIQSYVEDVNFGSCHLFSTRPQVLINRSAKRMLKNLVNDGKTVIQNFRQILKKLRDDFVSDVIVAVETNVFRILADVVSIGENVRLLGKDVKEVKEVGE